MTSDNKQEKEKLRAKSDGDVAVPAEAIAQEQAAENVQTDLLDKLEAFFPGRFVRKDLTQKIKEGANVPTYVLEFLLGQYANSSDPVIIERGVENVKKTLANNYVRPDEAEKVKSRIREEGAYTVIDKITVTLNSDKDRYEAAFGNLGITGVPVDERYVQDYERLLVGGIWSIVRVQYDHTSDDHFLIDQLTPVQVPSVNMQEVYDAREKFTTDEWIDLLLRTIGMEPTQFDDRVKWLMVSRLIPFVENNYNFVELGAGTKSRRRPGWSLLGISISRWTWSCGRPICLIRFPLSWLTTRLFWTGSTITCLAGRFRSIGRISSRMGMA